MSFMEITRVKEVLWDSNLCNKVASIKIYKIVLDLMINNEFEKYYVHRSR